MELAATAIGDGRAPWTMTDGFIAEIADVHLDHLSAHLHDVEGPLWRRKWTLLRKRS
jgi:hypothetical protein